MADLNRDYGVVKDKHQELLTRREQASITQKASQASDDIEFKVVDLAQRQHVLRQHLAQFFLQGFGGAYLALFQLYPYQKSQVNSTVTLNTK